ncbi:efflux RND transporter permease subunit [Shigella flexneri]
MATAEWANYVLRAAQHFPHGWEYKVAYETTSSVKASIEDVVKTLPGSYRSGFFVMYLFLQNFRATLIPTIAVPVVLMGLSGSRLWLQRQHLNHVRHGAAIGLLLHHAIAVVEKRQRIMSEEGLTPREATRKSMGQIQGAPGRDREGPLAGSVTRLLRARPAPPHRQFSITIVAAMVLPDAVFTTTFCLRAT